MPNHRRGTNYKGTDMTIGTGHHDRHKRRWLHLLIDLSPVLAVAMVLALILTGFGTGPVREPAQTALAQLTTQASQTAQAAAKADAPVAAPASLPFAAQAAKAIGTQPPLETYTVRKNDTFSKIAASRGVKDWASEAERIGLLCPEYLVPGQVITFATSANASLPCPGTSTVTASPASTDGSDADVQTAFNATDPASGQQFTVGLVANGGGRAKAALQKALGKVGKPYRWGASGPNAFDCSGLVKFAYKEVGVNNLPRTSSAMSRVGKPVAKSALQPGDLVFFYKPVSHVGIYVGNGKVVHASNKKSPVKVSDMSRMKFNSARRVA